MKQEFKKTYQQPKRHHLTSLGPFSSFSLPPSHYLLAVSPFLCLLQSHHSVWPGGSIAVVSPFCSGTCSHPASSCLQWWFSGGGCVSHRCGFWAVVVVRWEGEVHCCGLMWHDEVNVQHSSCDVLRVGWKYLRVNNCNTDKNPPFLGWKKLLKLVILKCEIYPLILTEKKTIHASGRKSPF